jgi:hypothetical protein
VKTTIIALSAVALIAAAPAVLAQGVPSKSSGQQHRASMKHHHPGVSGYAPLREMQAKGSKKGYPGAFGYAPEVLDRETEMSRQAGGGGGSGM